MKGMTEEQALKYLQDTLFVVGGKWKLPILRAIHSGSYRFRDIQRSLPLITTRVLSKELKHLEENKLVVRTVYQAPLAVEYKVPHYMHSLLPVIKEMILWGKNHRKKVSEQ
ncbi:DNA-binding HxlR family transcriptional regulator [Chitinophaga sp. W3I9]|uniref:winged helix-turn-helix transcriptional regulator n=1 Tax=unclassified Chitinophaga TaxID=2619133 RepID=UPI003D19BE88